MANWSVRQRACQGNKPVVECDYFAVLLVPSKNRRGGCILFGQNDATVVGGHLTNPGKHDRHSTVAGKSVVVLPGPRETWLYLPDDKTIVIGMAPLMAKMLAVKKVDSPLIKLLKTVDVSSQVTAVFSVDAVRPIMKQAVAAAPPVPPPFQGFLKLPDLLSAILLRVNVGERFQASFTLRGQDEASAEEVERLVNQGLAMARQMVMARSPACPAAQMIRSRTPA